MKAKNQKKSKNRCARKKSAKVKMSSTAKNLTSQAGLIPIVKFLDKINLEGTINQELTHKRGNNAIFQVTDVILFSLIGLIAGATSMTKVCAIWADGVLRKVAGICLMPVETTIQRILKELSEKHIAQMETINHRVRGQIWRRANRSGASKVGLNNTQVIDIDSTVDTVYGKQEGAAVGYNPKKKGALSYHPQIAFLVESKEILQAWFRTGNTHSCNGVLEFTKQLLAHLPKRIRVIIRTDSGYFVGALFDYLDSLEHGYLTKVKLKNLKKLLEKQRWTPIPGQKGWEQSDFQYQCGDWKKKRRFVAVRYQKPKEINLQTDLLETLPEYDYFCYVTTESLTPWKAHKQYGERATCETWIEESKSQMGLGHIRTDCFLANACLFQCAVLAYNTLRWMALMSGNPTLLKWEPETIRVYLVRTAGKMLTGGRQIMLKTPDSHLYPQIWDDWVAVGLSA